MRKTVVFTKNTMNICANCQSRIVAYVFIIIATVVAVQPQRAWAAWEINYNNTCQIDYSVGGQDYSIDQPYFSWGVPFDANDSGKITMRCNFHATLTFVDSSGNPDPAHAPPAVTVLEYRYADYLTITNSNMQADGSADDGGDSLVTPPSIPSPYNNSFQIFQPYSSGYHIHTLQVSNGTVEMPEVNMTAQVSGTSSDPDVTANGEVAVHSNYTVEVVNPCTVTASSTGGIGVTSQTGYFSGTDCTATGTVAIPAQLPANSYIDSAQLTIGGTTVNSYQDDGVNHSQCVNVSATFDSTHFGDGATVDVEMQATDNLGNKYAGKLGEDGDTTFKAFAKNRAYILENTSLDGPSLFGAYVGQACASMNYSVVVGSEDTTQEITNRIPVYTLFYACTHGDPQSFGDSQATFDGPDSEYVDWSAVHEEVLGKLPSQPPYNFVDIDACNSGGKVGEYWQHALPDGFGITGVDRAYVGWKGFDNDTNGDPGDLVLADNNSGWLRLFWQFLSSGCSVMTASLVAQLNCPQQGSNTEQGATTEIFPVVDGDVATRLHGVYVWSSRPSSAWYTSN